MRILIFNPKADPNHPKYRTPIQAVHVTTPVGDKNVYQLFSSSWNGLTATAFRRIAAEQRQLAPDVIWWWPTDIGEIRVIVLESVVWSNSRPNANRTRMASHSTWNKLRRVDWAVAEEARVYRIHQQVGVAKEARSCSLSFSASTMILE